MDTVYENGQMRCIYTLDEIRHYNDLSSQYVLGKAA
jgi:hypothetical protein